MKLIRFLVILLILVLPLGQLSRLPIFGAESTITVYINDLLLPVIFSLWLLWRLGIKKSVRLPFLSAPIFLFLSVALIALAYNIRFLIAKEFLESILYLLRWTLYAGIYFVVSDLVRGAGSKKEQTAHFFLNLVNRFWLY